MNTMCGVAKHPAPPPYPSPHPHAYRGWKALAETALTTCSGNHETPRRIKISYSFPSPYGASNGSDVARIDLPSVVFTLRADCRQFY